MGIFKSKEFPVKGGKIASVRSATVNDAEALLKVLNEVLADGEGMVLERDESPAKTVEDQKKWIKKFTEEPNEILLVAEVDGKIVGNLDLHASKRRRLSHSCSLGISLSPDWRSNGIGSALFCALFEWLNTAPQIEKITLKVLADNKRAIALYTKFGFVEEGRSIRAVKLGVGRYADDISMSCFPRVN